MGPLNNPKWQSTVSLHCRPNSRMFLKINPAVAKVRLMFGLSEFMHCTHIKIRLKFGLH